MIDPFWIAMIAGAIFIGCALGVASLTHLSSPSRISSSSSARLGQMTRYLCTVDAEVIMADTEQDARYLMLELLKLGAGVVNCTEIEGEKEL